MIYRAVVVLVGLVLVAALYGLIWLLSRHFLRRHGVEAELADRSTVLATWTFAGVAVGLVFAVFGAFVLGPWAFYRTARAHGVAVSDAAAVGWGLLVVAVSLVLAAGGLFVLLWSVGAV
ncbi:hypothetical protein EZI54_05455 [Marinobacter halodurans]|uniref:DUF4190 domain-containing protein n=1 Tax=Marinobacter halodurans TaxID=2528979 RepID=A0ABY1ZQ37_9GAMM|nr:hypothetical protein [Marinobacter halodurans]TBW57900.1 hypothetical protein EZI54_05455 [Marinobacter halodurans]